jgi:Gram-negative bacterial TonB protein C-terminal
MRLMLLALAVGLIVPGHAAAQRRLNSVQSWVVPSDLPEGSLGVGAYAVSKLEFQISETGQVDKCRVAFSDVDRLGKLACQLIKARAHYAPAYDKTGKPARARDQITVEWAQPPGLTVSGTVDYGGAWPIAEETWMRTTSVLKQTLRRKGKAYFRFRILPNGSVGECVAAALQGDPEDGKYICKRLQSNARFQSPVDESGAAFETIATMKYSWGFIGRSYDR